MRENASMGVESADERIYRAAGAEKARPAEAAY